MPSSQRPKRERNPEETRRKILDAAEGEFARKGYDGTRLRDIAVAVGVHHALLHHYFKDKEGLFRAVLERAIEGVSSRAFEVLRSTGDVPALCRTFVETLVDAIAENQNLALILHFASLDEGSPAYSVCEDIGFRIVQPLLAATTEAIRSGQKTGSIRADIDARRILTTGIGAVAFIYHADRLFKGIFQEDVRHKDTVQAHKDATVTMLLEGIVVKG